MNLTPQSIADDIIDLLDCEGVILRDPLSLDDGVYSVNPAAIDTIATAMLAIFADVIAGILDAGSERDAVNESEEMLNAFRTELTSWTKPGIAPIADTNEGN